MKCPNCQITLPSGYSQVTIGDVTVHMMKRTRRVKGGAYQTIEEPVIRFALNFVDADGEVLYTNPGWILDRSRTVTAPMTRIWGGGLRKYNQVHPKLRDKILAFFAAQPDVQRELGPQPPPKAVKRLPVVGVVTEDAE